MPNTRLFVVDHGPRGLVAIDLSPPAGPIIHAPLPLPQFPLPQFPLPQFPVPPFPLPPLPLPHPAPPSPLGAFLRPRFPLPPPHLASPKMKGLVGATLQPNGHIAVADRVTNAIRSYDPGTGAWVTLIASGLDGPTGVAARPDGQIYVVDIGASRRLFLLDPVTATLTELLVGGLLTAPSAVTVTTAGAVWIADQERGLRLAQPPSGALAPPLPPAMDHLGRPTRSVWCHVSAGPNDSVVATDLAGGRVVLVMPDFSVIPLAERKDGLRVPVSAVMVSPPPGGPALWILDAGANAVLGYVEDAGSWVLRQTVSGHNPNGTSIFTRPVALVVEVLP